MYHEYWSLTEPAFENLADPEFFCRFPQHEEALNRLIYAVKACKGGAMLIGEIGSGKTLICRSLVLELAPQEKWQIGVVTQPMLSPFELLREILYQLGIDHTSNTRTHLLHALHDQMVKNYEEDRHMVVIVDEVQAITNMKTLDQLRLLLNFQLNKRFLLTLILVGQPEFERKITNMPALANRINIRYCLGGLSPSQTGEYVAHRLRIAGSKNNIFTEEAIKTIHAYSRGIPREINNLCDLGLLVGFNQKLTSIGQEVIKTLGRPWLGKRI